MARGLASRRTMTIGVLLNDLHNPFFADIAYAIEEAAAAVGYRLLIITGGRHQRREQAMLDALLEYRTDGLILVSPHMPAAVDRRRRRHSPLIVLGRADAPEHARLGHDRRGRRRAPRGRAPRASSATRGSSTSTAAAARARPPRRAGYLKAMEDFGLAPHAPVVPGEFTEAAGHRRRRAAARPRSSCRPRSSPPTTSWPPAPWTASRTRGCASPRTSRSSASTTRSWPRCTTCR